MDFKRKNNLNLYISELKNDIIPIKIIDKENIKIEFLSDDFKKNATGCLYMVKDYEGRNPTYMTTIDLEDETFNS